MKIAATLAAIILLQQSGCNDQAVKPPDPSPHHYPPIHRFENVSGPGITGVALDTVTGQYCKTWEWEYKTKEIAGGLDMLPTCLSIYQNTPSSGDPRDPLGLFNQPK